MLPRAGRVILIYVYVVRSALILNTTHSLHTYEACLIEEQSRRVFSNQRYARQHVPTRGIVSV